MEKHLLHGKIITEIKRPPKRVIEGFSTHDVAKIGDSMGRYGLLDYRIKPVLSESTVCGTAVTVLTRPGDALYVQKIIDILKPGDVVVIDAGGIEDLSCIGERLSYYMQLKGAAGVVVDGAVRDVRGIINIGFPAFAKSVCARIFGSNGPGAINVPIQCGGIIVNPGDIIVGDDDGVVCVPKEDAGNVLKAADEHLEGELRRLKIVEQEGKSITETFNLEERLKKWM